MPKYVLTGFWRGVTQRERVREERERERLCSKYFEVHG